MRIKQLGFKVNISTIFLIAIIFLLQLTSIPRNWNSFNLSQNVLKEISEEDTTPFAFAKPNDDFTGMKHSTDITELPGIVVQSYPVNIAVNSKTDKIYVANYFSNSISVIDGKTNTVIGNITTGIGLQNVVVSPVLNRIYVHHHQIVQKVCISK